MTRWQGGPIVAGGLLLFVACGCAAGSKAAGTEQSRFSRRAADPAGNSSHELPFARQSVSPPGKPASNAPAESTGEIVTLSHVEAQTTTSVQADAPRTASVLVDEQQRSGESQSAYDLPPNGSPLPEPVPGQPVSQDARQPLRLEEVVASVENHFPLLLAAMQELGITSGQVLAAQGAFDLNLKGREFWQEGTFDSQRFNLGVERNLAWNGVSYFAGYRQADGAFPIYYGDRKTGDGGEFRAGFQFPLLANRVIDRRRATLRQAQISRALADPTIAAQRIDFIRAASRAYWTWVAAGWRYQIAHSVLRIAEDRDKQLAELVTRGAVAEFERIDNQRVIVERQARLVVAERAWQQASIALSLYLRDASGQPRVPPATRMPREIDDPQPFDRTVLPADIELAFRQRPELERLRLQRERAGVEWQLANNQRLPSLNLGVEGYQDVGIGSSFSKTPLVTGTQLDRSAYLASLQLDVPLERREARGRGQSAQAAMVQLNLQEQFQRDRIVAEIQDAASALERFHELLRKARENVSVARKVESGERERFMRGQGTIVILNLRELVTAEASFAEVDALAEYYRAQADYRAALGLDARLNGPP